jgi:hypothetical protein
MLPLDQKLYGSVDLSRGLRQAKDKVSCQHLCPALLDVVVMFDGVEIHVGASHSTPRREATTG